VQESTSLFRPAALAANRAKGVGEIVLIRPVSFGLLTAMAGVIACAVVGLLACGIYTKHSTLHGQLMPDRGVAKVHAPQHGTIIERRVVEGQAVERGDVLYVISSERLSSALGATQALAGRQLDVRRRSLDAQIEKTRLLEHMDRESLERHIAALVLEIGAIGSMIDDQRRRVALAEGTALRHEQIHATGFVSKEQLVAKQDALLDQRSRLRSLERERDGVERQVAEVEGRLSSLSLEYQNEVAELERAVVAIELDMTENEARREVNVVSPQQGVATAVVGEVGYTVDVSKPLLSIVPRDAVLQAQLYAPSRSVGFVGVGDEVLLRYEAYPYQKFGHHRGTVAAVSRTALAPAELGSGGMGANAAAEPLYRITVELESQTVSAYGQPRELQPGMVVEADVLQETRRLYEWVLEPLHTLGGRVH
jgi:membrane fusion protein